MAAVKISETDGHSGLQALHVIASACRGFLGPEKSIKLISSPEDDGCEMIFTTHKLLSLLDIEHPSGYLLRDACRSHFKQYGTGCTTLVCMSGAWALAFETLLSEGIPGDAILRYGDEIIKLCLDVCEEEAINCTKIFQAFKVPEHKKQALLKYEKYDHQMKVRIPREEKSTKDEAFGINHSAVPPQSMPHTVDDSTGMIGLSGTNKQIDLDLMQALPEDTSSLTAIEDTDGVDDVSWYFDSNDEKLEESQNYSPSGHDGKPSQSDKFSLDNFETSMSTCCSEDISVESPVNLTAHFERKEESPSLVDGKIYGTHFNDNQWTFRGEIQGKGSQDTRSLCEQDVNSLLVAGTRSQTNLLAANTALQVQTSSTNCDSKTGISRESLTSSSLQESTNEIDACLKNLNISKKILPSRFPSKKQILRNSRHFQNEEKLSEMKVTSELVNNFTDNGEKSLEISPATSRKHSTNWDDHQLDGSDVIGSKDMVSSATKAEDKSSLTSPSPKASRTSFEISSDSGAELISGPEKRPQLSSQPLKRIFTNQEVPLTSGCKIEREPGTDPRVSGLNGVCSVQQNQLEDCIFQNSKILCTSLKLEKSTNAVDAHSGEYLTKVYTSSSPSKVFEKKIDNIVSPKMVLSDVACSTTAVSKSIPDFKNLCEGLSHGAGTSMCLARDVFINSLQSDQFEDPYICRVLGPTTDYSAVIDGLIVPCDIKMITLASSLRGKSLKAVLINGDLTKNYRHAGFKGPFEVKVVVGSVKVVPNSPQDIWLKKVMEIINKFQISLVLVKGHADASLIDQCMGYGTLIVPRVPYSALQYLSSKSNTSMNSYLRGVTEEDICEGLYLDCWEAGWEATIRSLHTQRTAYVRLWGPCNIQTTMICAPSNPQLQNQEEKFLSSYSKLKDVLKTGLVCPGIGATEIKVMRRLEEFQANITPTSSGNFEDSIKRKVAGAFQAGFEEFIIWLVQNSRDITKFDVKSVIYDLVSPRSSDSKSIQENLFPLESQETESMWNVFMKSCTQTERQHMCSANIDTRDSFFNRFCKGFCTSGKGQSVSMTDGISLTDTGYGHVGSSQISRLVVFDCLSSKTEAWQSAWSLIKHVMSIDAVLTIGLSTKELESCKNIVF